MFAVVLFVEQNLLYRLRSTNMRCEVVLDWTQQGWPPPLLRVVNRQWPG